MKFECLTSDGAVQLLETPYQTEGEIGDMSKGSMPGKCGEESKLPRKRTLQPGVMGNYCFVAPLQTCCVWLMHQLEVAAGERWLQALCR